MSDSFQNLTDIAALLRDQANEKEKKSNAAKARISAETAAALEVRDAAMRGIVRRNALTDISEFEGSTVRERQGQRRKYAFRLVVSFESG